MKKIKTSQVVVALIALLCMVIFKDYLLLKKAYFFYDINSDGFYIGYPFTSNLCGYFAHFFSQPWSFKVGMGQNLFPFLLRDPFNIIYYLAGKDSILYLTIYVEVLKMMLCGIIFFKYLRLLGLSDFVSVAGSLLFSFCGFITVGSAWFIFTFEALNFALLLYGFERFFVTRRWVVLSMAVFLLAISMPFNLYVYGVFMVFYAITRYVQAGNGSARKFVIFFLQLTGIIAVGILLSGPFIWHNVWLLLHSPRGSNMAMIRQQMEAVSPFRLADRKQAGTCIMRFFSNDLLGSSSHYKGWGNILEAPLFYCGLPCLLLVPQVFPLLTRRARILSVIFISVWLLPLIFPYYRFAFWLFTGDYYRAYSFFVAFVFMWYALQALHLILIQQKINLVLLAASLAVLLFLLYYPLFIYEDILVKSIQLFTGVLLVVYALLLAAIGKFGRIRWLKYVFALVLITELGVSGWITANQRDAFSLAWLHDNKVLYTDSINDAVQYVQAHDHSFYRIDKNLDPTTSRFTGLNFNQRQGYNATSSYNPFNELHYIRYLQAMGVVNPDIKEEAQWAIGLVDQPILQCQNRVKYYLGQNHAQPAWPAIWDSVAHVGDVTVFRNKEVLPLGYGYRQFIRRSSFDSASSQQRQWISLRAFVIDDKDVDSVARLPAFRLSDTICGTFGPDAFIREVDSLKKDTLALTSFTDSRFEGDVDLSENKVICLSVPYDEGWHARVDITETKPLIINGGMMGVFMEKGRHHLTLHYELRFMTIGLLMSLIGFLLIIVLNWRNLIKGTAAKASQINKGLKSVLDRFGLSYAMIPVVLAVPVVIFFYFIKWKTTAIYGDDLACFQTHSHLNTLFEKINMSLIALKYRPVGDLAVHLIIVLFGKNLSAYYCFNVGIQAVNTIIFAGILNQFLKSPFFSIVFSLLLGLSRFSFYNMTQIMLGGAIEGLAMTFFLASLYFISDVLTDSEIGPSERFRKLCVAIFLANICLYVHERYIVVLPFILLMVFVSPVFKKVSWKCKSVLSLFVVSSLIFNVFVKKHFFSLPFLVGTGGSHISISLSSMITFIKEAVLTLLQINSGPDYLIGYPFNALSIQSKLFILVFVFSLTIAFFVFIFKLINAMRRKQTTVEQFSFIFLTVLFGFLLLPAVSTIRLEQRWLQAPFCVFLLLVVIVLKNLPIKSIIAKRTLLYLFFVISMSVNYVYLSKGADNFYFSSASHVAKLFKKSIINNTLKDNLETLYIVENQKDVNTENALIWTLGDGEFFGFYGNNKVKLAFVDKRTLEQDSLKTIFSQGYHRKTDEIVVIGDTIENVADKYIKDSVSAFLSK